MLKNYFKIIFILVLSINLFIACSNTSKSKYPPIDPQGMDLTVRPGDDFYQYANGTWIKNNPIPDEYSRYGAFEILRNKNLDDLRTILEAATKANAPTGTIMQKIGDFYSCGMDSAKIQADGLTSLQAEFARIDDIATIADVQRQVAYLHTHRIYPLFSIYASADDKNSAMTIAQLAQGGLGLPDRDYYLKDDPRSIEIRTEYVSHVTKMMELFGKAPDEAAAIAQRIMNIETKLAEASFTRLERRDPHKNYNKMNSEQLAALAPQFDWNAYFQNIGLTDPGDINVQQTKFFQGVNELMNTIPILDWKDYLRWNLLNEAADYLSIDFEKQNFKFYGNVLSGTKTMRPRWKRVLASTNYALSEAVGQLYVEKFFPPEAKQRMLDLVQNLKASLGERIQQLDWMSEVTKQKALEKLAVMNVKIGYPDKWIDYTKLEIHPDSYVLNAFRGNQFNFKRDMDKVGKPVDKGEWEMSPQTVNAYYNPNMNEIVFPAAILQYPYFSMEADDAVNYGAIGMVIGHEMTHGFDDQGRQYDKEGNLNDWWTEEDATKFKERYQLLVEQYNQFIVLDSLHVDGDLTLGENIADLGGANIAYESLQKALAKNPQSEMIDGFAPAQRFFLSLAQVWRQNIRDKELMRRIKEDVHSPGKFRVNGPVSNMPEFYAAFQVQPGDALYRAEDKRAKIW